MTNNICNICGANQMQRIPGGFRCLACDAVFLTEAPSEETALLTLASDNLLRQEFATAEEQFDNIIRRYPNNHRAYWGFVCARYGIRYEEDYDGKRIPTCCMPTIESFLDDVSFLKAVELAPDEQTKKWYRGQADYIERVRKTWIEKARNEAPYDLFLCYKNTADLTGVMDLYIHLSETYRVFFSRESLRDKIGEKYEPYIFNALQTAKVMIVYGSSAEDVTATWPKNEWQRFCKQIRNGEKAENALIVVCDGFDPSELPSMLSSRQCLDATKKTFYPDLDKALSALFRPTATPIPKIAAVQSRPKKEVPKDHVHTYTKREIPSTCVERGYTLYTCDCGDEYKDQFKDFAPHDYKLTKTIEPFCTDKGSKRYNCTVCGHEKIEELPAPGHAFTEWSTSKRATCTEKGTEQRTCTNCGKKETRPLTALGHDFTEWRPSNTDPNKEERFCRRCGEKEVRVGKEANKLYDAGMRDLQNKKYESARENLRLAAEKGLPEAQYQYALLLRSGGKETKKAGVWLKKAADNGNKDAQVVIKKGKKDTRNCILFWSLIVAFLIVLFTVIIPKSRTCYYYHSTSLNAYETGLFHSVEYNSGVSKTKFTKVISNYDDIRAGAFREWVNLKKVSLGDHVSRIGDSAFSGCSKLKNVTLGNGIQYIASNAFDRCFSLKYNKYDNGLYLGTKDNPYFALIKAKNTTISSCVIHENTKIICEGAFENWIPFPRVTFFNLEHPEKALSPILET